MPKQASAKASTKRRRKAGKIGDLPARAVKTDKAAAVKGGIIVGNTIGTDIQGTPTKGN